MIKIKTNKKGMSIQDAGMLLYRIILVTIGIGIFAMFVSVVLSPFPNINNAKGEILLGRLLYSEAIHYEDPLIGRVNSNIVDVDKLIDKQSSNTLDAYFRDQFYHPTRTNIYVFNISVSYRYNNTDYKKSFVSNETAYKLLNPKKSFQGKGAVTGIAKLFLTQCKFSNEFIPCYLELNLLIPNS